MSTVESLIVTIFVRLRYYNGLVHDLGHTQDDLLFVRRHTLWDE